MKYILLALSLICSASFAQAGCPTMGVKPTPQNTGLSNPKALPSKNAGLLSITNKTGVVVQDKFYSKIVISNSSVTIKNTLIDGSSAGYHGIYIMGASNVTIKNSEIRNVAEDAIFAVSGSSSVSIDNLYAHDIAQDGLDFNGHFSMNHVLLTRINTPWILRKDNSAHSDAMQLQSGANDVITNSYFDVPWGLTHSNSVLFLQGLGSKITNMKVQGNWISGGNFSIQPAGQSGMQVIGNVIYNQIGNDINYGIYRNSVGGSVTWNCNVDGNGKPLSN